MLGMYGGFGGCFGAEGLFALVYSFGVSFVHVYVFLGEFFLHGCRGGVGDSALCEPSGWFQVWFRPREPNCLAASKRSFAQIVTQMNAFPKVNILI